MKRIIYWIRQHQIVAFFMISFGITWGLGFTYDVVMNEGMDLLLPLAAVATCGPALGGIIVTRITNIEPKSGSTKPAWGAFLVALILSTAAFLVHNTLINHAPFSTVMVVFVLVFAMPVAYVISAAFSRVPAVRRYLSSLVSIRRVWGWLLLALIVPAVLSVISIVVSNLLGRQSIHYSSLTFKGLTLLRMFAVTFFYQFFFFNGTGEEVGWRGFALPRLQAHTSPLIASLILSFFWPVWHVFFWKAGGEPVSTWHFWQDNFMRLLPATVMINWFYNRSRGSILVAGVTHAAANSVFEYMPRIDWPVHTATLYTFALAIILIDRMWRKLSPDHPAVVRALGESENKAVRHTGNY